MQTPEEAYTYLSRTLRLSPRETVVMSSRLGLNGLKLTLKEIGEVLGVTRERIRQIEHMVITRDRAGIVGKFKAAFPCKRKGMWRVSKAMCKDLLIKWIKDSGSFWCCRCRMVKDPGEYCKTNHYCTECLRRKNSLYRSENSAHIKELKKRYRKKYSSLGYVGYKDKLVVKRFL